jgi:aryl-alcohol dehydrogenase-like predicted oxidoreductase
MYRRTFDENDPVVARKLDVVDELLALAESAGVSLVELAVSFVLTHPAVTSAIIGPRTYEQLESQLPAVDVRLGSDVLDRIDQLVTPGTDVVLAEAGYLPPTLTDAALRRRW